MVVGSSPTWGAEKSPEFQHSGLSLCHFLQEKKGKSEHDSGSDGVQDHQMNFFMLYTSSHNNLGISRNLSEMVRFVTTIFCDFSNLVGLLVRSCIHPSSQSGRPKSSFFRRLAASPIIYPKWFDLLPRFWTNSRIWSVSVLALMFIHPQGEMPERHVFAPNTDSSP